MLSAIFAFIEVLLNIVLDVAKKLVGYVFFGALAVVAIFMGSVITIIYILT